jgi:aspartate 1-decarboxylase
MLRAKIHRARVTAKSLDYAGSITIDSNLLELADVREFEKVLVVNLSNGLRAETYAISGRRGSGDVCLNGAAARLGETGDRVIIMSFAFAEDKELDGAWRPRIVRVDDNNRPCEKP